MAIWSQKCFIPLLSSFLAISIIVTLLTIANLTLSPSKLFMVKKNHQSDWQIERKLSTEHEFRVQNSKKSFKATKNKFMDLSPNITDEFEVLKSNLDKCLQASKLFVYFKSIHFYDRAQKNAAHLFSLIRSVAPKRYEKKYKIPCWKATFEIELSSTNQEFFGAVNGKPFTVSQYDWTKPTLTVLKARYNGHKHSKLMCLPNIFLAGFPKCGSTYVYCLLRKIATFANLSSKRAEIEKAPRVWVGEGPYHNHQYPHQLADLAHYVFNFMPAVDMISQNRLVIDGSPNLIFQWPHYSRIDTIENYCLLPAVLSHILPNNKYIVVMREPASMLYSAFWFSCVTAKTKIERAQQLEAPNAFHRKVVQRMEIFRSCIIFSPVDKCLFDIFYGEHSITELNCTTKGVSCAVTPNCLKLRFEVGFYYYYIRRWLAVVPRDQFFFLTMEELNINPPYEELLDFLSLQGMEDRDSVLKKLKKLSYQDINCETNTSKFYYKSDPALKMRTDTKIILQQFFQPYNQKLASLLDDPKFLWNN